jgi:16S rRNA (uracil1498-N3)-methyltransferase
MTTAPVFLVDALPEVDEAVLDGAEGWHAAAVRRLRPGEPIALADGVGGLADCTVAAAERGRLVLTVRNRTYVPPARPRFVVVQALAKGGRGGLAVELMTELGVDLVVPWVASRSVVRWQDDRGERALARWRTTAREAAKQARRSWLPVVEDLHNSGQVAALLAAAATAVVLHEAAKRPLVDLTVPADGDLVVVVGPEGGLTEAELAAFRGTGAHLARLGGTVLRTSTAGAAAVAVLAARTGRWS